MHRLIITLTAPNELEQDAVLGIFARQLEDVAEDLTAMPAQNQAFGAFGDAGCKVYYRVEISERPAELLNFHPDSPARQTDLPAVAGL